MATNYTGDPTATQAPASPPAAGVAPILSLPVDTDAFDSAAFYQFSKVLADYVAWITTRSLIVDDIYGSGADGTQASGFGTINMARDMEWSNLTMNATDVLNTNGFLPRVRNTFTAVAGAVVDCGAGAGSNAGGRAGTIGAGGDGGAAAAAGSGGVGIGGNGGGGGGGGGGGSITTPSFAYKVFPVVMQGFGLVYTGGVPAIAPIRGGGGGGGGVAGGGTGGPGGGGGGVVWMAARVVNAVCTFRARGGAGTAGAGGNAGGGGGGGGGGGILIRRTATLVTVTMDVIAGLGGTGAGTGAGGVNGVAGNGTLIQVAL